MSRMDRMNEVFKREIGNMILMGDVSDPRLASVTITYVDISKDLSWAHVGFSVLNDGEAAVRAAQNGLSSASSRMRKLLGARVVIRYLPQLKFVYDSSVAEGFRMALTLDEIRRQREGSIDPEVNSEDKDQHESS